MRTEVAQAPVTAPTPNLSMPEPPSELPPDQSRILREARQGLQALTEQSPHALTLLRFYDTRRLLGYVDNSTIRAFETSPTDGVRRFYVVGNPTRRLEAGDTGVYAEFSCYPHPVMTLHDSNASSMTRGLLLAHELEHARDCLLNGEPESEQFSDVWLQGELNAYRTTQRILNELSNGAWTRSLVPNSWRERQAILTSQGRNLQESAFGDLPSDRSRFTSVFPFIDHDLGFLSYLGTQMNLDANGYNVSRVARERGISPQDEARVQIEMIRGYYQSFIRPVIEQSSAPSN